MFRLHTLAYIHLSQLRQRLFILI